MKKWMSFALAGAFAATLNLSGALAQSKAKRFENWTYDCTQGVCQIYITLADQQNNKSFALTVVHDAASNTYSGILKMPLGVALPPGVRIFTNMKDNYALPFQFCEADGCNAVAKLEPKLVAQMRKVPDVQVEYFVYGKQQRDAFRISMQGFPAAVEALVAGNK